MYNWTTTRKRILMIVLVLAFFCLTACQPTPQQPVVGNKSEDLVEQIVEANTQEKQSELKEDKQVIEEQIKKVNGHLELEIDPSEMVTIKVDADIISPGFEKIPLVRVKPKNFTKEQFAEFIEFVTDGEPVYYEDFAEGFFHLSKEEIDAILPKMMEYEANDELPGHVKEHINHLISDYKENYDIAISKADERLYDGELTQAENNSMFSSITSLKCYLDKDQAARLSLWQSINEAQSQMQFFNHDFGVPYNTCEPYQGVDAQRMNMSYDEAKAVAEEFVRTIDGEETNMVMYESNICCSVGSFANHTKETSPQAYCFRFARQYNGVEIKPVMHLFNSDEHIDYSKQVYPESINITIDDNGINMAFWCNYTEYIETLAEDAPLMSFEEIQEIFEQQCRNEFSWVPRNDALLEQPTVTLNVKKIELNLMVIPEKDNLESYITVPVWDFIADEDYDKEVMCQDGYPGEGQKNCSIMTINAVDGTIISREQGY